MCVCAAVWECGLRGVFWGAALELSSHGASLPLLTKILDAMHQAASASVTAISTPFTNYRGARACPMHTQAYIQPDTCAMACVRLVLMPGPS
jgi:hypothetical protein